MGGTSPAAHSHRSESFQENKPNIQDYALIGDCRSGALIRLNGSIDWLCWPRFDSSSIFAALLDFERGGYWRIGSNSSVKAHVSRAYVERTNVLQTTFTSDEGTLTLKDLMPVFTESTKRNVLLPDHELIRQVVCTEGEMEVEFDFYPRRDYGARNVKFRKIGDLGFQFEASRGVYYLRSSVPLKIENGRMTAQFVLRRGEEAYFSLTYSEVSPVVLPPLGQWTRQRIEETELWWRGWAACATYEGPYRNEVVRSALALKLLTYSPSGAVIAAATTSLPEQLGGPLNWDYRFCWLRDASLTVRALMGLGYSAEADAFMEWLLSATRLTQPELRILYTVFGENSPREKVLSHLRGFRDSRPVRVGNAARHQLQLDVYGEVVDAAAQYAFHGGKFDRYTTDALLGFGRYVAENWNRPDQGIWEPREGPQPHTHSRVLCWTALDRLVTLAKKKHLPDKHTELFVGERDQIARQVKARAWNEKLNTYTSILDGNELDASLLLMSYYGFEAPDSERMQATYAAIKKTLRAGENLLYRYVNAPSEGAFGICSFWETEFLALGGGSVEETEELFRSLLAYRNDVGLYAEEVDPRTGNALGNFPQAFTHVGLISAALSLTERIKGEKQLAHRKPAAEAKNAA
jgi:GH15 family glucan-1,4-alpha-glucosidase